MAIGYFLLVGDKTTCGGQIITGDPTMTFNGRAPYSRKTEQIGKRVKIELHHIQQISKEGDVYNLDNINAITPKQHIEIHKNGK